MSQFSGSRFGLPTSSANAVQSEDYLPEEPLGWSPLVVAIFATVVLVLALGGGLFGLYAAYNEPGPPRGAGPTGLPTSRPQTVAPTTPPGPTESAGPSPTPSEPPIETVSVPDANGMNFQAVRSTVRGLGLGWQLVFEGGADDPTVRTTEPAGGAEVPVGTVVTIFVHGVAPQATVPDVVGRTCFEAAVMIIDSGLYPEYLTGQEGSVTEQSPTASDPPTLVWNDKVQVSCG